MWALRRRAPSPAAVASAPTLLTAAIHDAPESHDGEKRFTFELRFSEDPKEDFSYKTLRDHAFTVTRGTVAGARRLAGDSDAAVDTIVAVDDNLPVIDTITGKENHAPGPQDRWHAHQLGVVTPESPSLLRRLRTGSRTRTV